MRDWLGHLVPLPAQFPRFAAATFGGRLVAIVILLFCRPAAGHPGSVGGARIVQGTWWPVPFGGFLPRFPSFQWGPGLPARCMLGIVAIMVS